MSLRGDVGFADTCAARQCSESLLAVVETLRYAQGFMIWCVSGYSIPLY
jgi:hypothetical protein